MTTPHLFTLTGNLLAERTLEFDGWTPGKTQRARRETFQVGGKGINVSKMLMRLGVPNTALCFTGGAAGAECEAWLRERSFDFRAFATQAPTRGGTVVRDGSDAHKETTFLGPDVPPDEDAVRQCAAFLDEQPAGQILAVCGSFPGWASLSAAPLRQALQRWGGRGLLVVDTYGPPLVELAEWPLALLKVNADELRSLSTLKPTPIPLAPQRVVVTDGPGTIRVRDYDATCATFEPPRVREISATGSGDVLLAVIMQALFLRKVPLQHAVEFAIPYAAANAAHEGIGEFPFPGSTIDGMGR
jgi:fructose-1-phosphate kinase PfkB-like protein